MIRRVSALLIAFGASFLLSSCAELDLNSAELTRNTTIELVDWHVVGLWVINSPVAWVRVTNYNNVPLHDITFEYDTYDLNGKFLNKGEYTIEGTVQPHSSKNFAELYVGLVDLYSERLSIKLLRVKEKHH
ncbi:MAG: hypothetical protein K2W82_08075 [Candidatus Obscuribacterales bacterium]|nr:hypothetical protein [Candidatus Obscuribacterales bacterium]